MDFHFYRIISSLIIFSLIGQNQCFYKKRVRVESDKIYIKYEHQLKDGSSDFTQIMDTSIFRDVKPNNCTTDVDKEYCLKWGDSTQFKINKLDQNCENFEFVTEFNLSLSVTFNISGLHVYGGSENTQQSWPINKFDRITEPFVSSKLDAKAVLDPYWIISTGFYLYVYEGVPLFVSLNNTDETLTIIASRRPPYIRPKNITSLKYKVCKYDNIKIAQEHAIVDTLGKPKGVPDFKMVQLPIWSTWAKYKSNISDGVVLQFAELINHYGFPNSQIEIDDKWETCYGSFEIDTKKFADMKKLVNRLNTMGFRVTIWVHPFINYNCEPFYSYAKENGFFVMNTNGSIATEWWNGNASQIDFTNDKAVEWWVSRLKKLLKETEINSYKFDAGESSWCPQVPVFKKMDDDHPETILKSYINTVALFGDMIEVRSARNTQHHSIFVRMIDRETRWNGLLSMQTIIPTLLNMNILGYPFVLPDMIGGNGYGQDVLTEEMFIRWLQINVFMPSLQFSYPPWDFVTREIINVTKKYIDIHKLYSNKIYDLMKESTVSGAPVNRPLWWLDPEDNETYHIDSEFLLGDDILVAPVIEEGATTRDIYLPKGIWKDETNKNAKHITGPIWLRDYPADIEILPYFSKISRAASFTLPVSLLFASLFVIMFLCR